MGLMNHDCQCGACRIKRMREEQRRERLAAQMLASISNWKPVIHESPEQRELREDKQRFKNWRNKCTT